MRFIRHPKDFAAGALFAAFGAAAIAIADRYPLGTAARMGPGYFPRLLGWLLIVLGAVLALRSLRLAGAPIAFGSPKPVVIVLGSVVLFGFLSPHVGLALAIVLLVALASAGSSEFRWREALVSAIVLAAGAVLVFVKGLGLQFSIWPALAAGG